MGSVPVLWLIGPLIALTTLLAMRRGWFGLSLDDLTWNDLTWNQKQDGPPTPVHDAVLLVGGLVVGAVCLWLLLNER